MIKLYISILAAFFLLGCTQAATPEEHPIIAAYSNSYNEKDIETMRALMHPHIEWVAINGNETEVHMSGKEALATEMESWFENPNLPKGSLRDWSINGDTIAVTETAHWTTKDGAEKSQSALTVYELENDLVRRVYYFPETKD